MAEFIAVKAFLNSQGDKTGLFSINLDKVIYAECDSSNGRAMLRFDSNLEHGIRGFDNFVFEVECTSELKEKLKLP